jgi:hypothetical protein
MNPVAVLVAVPIVAGCEFVHGSADSYGSGTGLDIVV